MTFDLLIKNGWIVDGTGSPKFFGDVAVKHGKIAEVGVLDSASADQVIDADGLTVAPGFLDIHTHYDAQVTWDPLLESSCWHGVTTVVMGNCGFTVAPCRPGDRQYLAGMLSTVEGMSRTALEQGINWTWESYPQYLDALGRDFPLGMNVAVFAGHSAIRRYVMGGDARERVSTPEELEAMRQLLREALLAGAIGFSTAQIELHIDHDRLPIPSRLASQEEILGLASVLRELNVGTIQVAGNVDAKAVALASRRPVIGGGGDNEAAAFAEGGQLWSQALPGQLDYLLSLGLEPPMLLVPLDKMPAWTEALYRPVAEKLQILRDPNLRERMRSELKTPTPLMTGVTGSLTFRGDWERMVVEQTALPENARFRGRNIAEISREQGKDELDTILDLSLAEGLQTWFRLLRFSGDLEKRRRGITNPYVIPGNSDAGAHMDRRCMYGMPGMLIGQWVREEGLISLEEGVRQVTSLPAQVFGMPGRGSLREGMQADIVIFDPEQLGAEPAELVRDLPGGATRFSQKGKGIAKTIVNGELFIDEGKHTGALSGQVVRNKKAVAVEV